MEISRAVRSALVTAVLAVTGGAPCLLAQFGVFRNLGYTSQAKTQEEFDLYLEVLDESDPAEQVVKADRFVAEYPQSELRGQARQHQMLAYRHLNDMEGVLRAGEEVLVLVPNNMGALLTLASALPNATAGRTDARQLLEKAEGYAREALDLLARKQIPRSIPYREWEELRDQMAAGAHEALGHVAAKRGDMKKAVAEFTEATQRNPQPEGRQFYRLGVAYAWTGKDGEALAALQRAAELGPELVTELAKTEIEKLRKNRTERLKP